MYISYASEETARHLDISVGTPVIDSELCVFDINGDPIHTVREIVRGDNNKYMRWYV
ncbi:MAG: hypothetical protein HFH11_13320 [Dorea sp.]|nr:hypothetical protein [Dorea sp.]